MIRPLLQGEALVRDIAAGGPQGGFRLWWLGQSGFLLQWEGRHLLLDPYLSDSLTRKYAGTQRPHVRLTEIPLAPALLPRIDVLTSSHRHTDHLDAETIQPVLAASPGVALVVPEAERGFVAERLGIDPTRPLGLDDGREVAAAGFRFRGVAAAHEELQRDAAGRCRFLGYLIRFGPWTVYHSGDTVPYPDLAPRLRPYRPDVALLPINGRDARRGVAGNLDGPEAARLAHDVGAGLAIPCHYEMFAFNTASTEPFAAAATALGQPFRLLRCGERWSSEELGHGSR